MVVKNLFDPAVKQEIIARINKLNPGSKALWGKMNVSQMLAHVQVPIGVADGSQKLKRTFFGRVVGPMVKSIIYNDKPFKRSLPTDPSFVMFGNEKDFETERTGSSGSSVRSGDAFLPVLPGLPVYLSLRS